MVTPMLMVTGATMKATLTDWYIGATDDQRERGRRWYPEALSEVLAIADESGYTVPQVANVLATLSPRKRWEGNLRLTWEVVVGNREGGHFGTMIRAALDVLTGDLTELPGAKVRSFAANILGDEDAVTIDVWMLRAMGEDAERRLTDTQYHRLADEVREVASELGVTPRTLQATVWIAIREEGGYGA